MRSGSKVRMTAGTLRRSRIRQRDTVMPSEAKDATRSSCNRRAIAATVRSGTFGASSIRTSCGTCDGIRSSAAAPVASASASSASIAPNTRGRCRLPRSTSSALGLVVYERMPGPLSTELARAVLHCVATLFPWAASHPVIRRLFLRGDEADDLGLGLHLLNDLADL